MVDAAKTFYPYIPVNLLLKDKFENYKKIKKIDSPILVMHGEIDQIVPFSMGMYAYTFPTASGVGIGTGDQGTIGSAVDADEFIAEIDLDDTAAGHVIGSILKNAANSDIPVLPYLNDVDACIALTAGSITAAPTSGIFRVYATLMDVSDVGDLTSETADRDT